jgi:NlpC/P60 family putative phage cell wall peptidase
MSSAGFAGAHPRADEIVAEALAWVGTPYRHQAASKGVGSDCLGLVRGVWRKLYGCELDMPDSYAPDWAEAGGEERLLFGARQNFRARGGGEPFPGDLLIFRWRPHLPAKHAGILVGENRFVHAYQSGGKVTNSVLVPQWRRRIAGVFAFPQN